MNALRRSALLFSLLSLFVLPVFAQHGEPDIIPEPRVIPDPIPPHGGFSPFLLENTHAEVRITPPVARTVLTQTWKNPNADPVDGLYIFPLPEDAAVSAMELQIGSRVIKGQIRRRAEAREIYERARREGRVAGLTDQERDNVFVQRVANILPGVEVKVRLVFDQPLGDEGGELEYVLPTVVGPRFVPASMGDPGQINPPVAGEGVATGHRFELDAWIEAGVTVGEIRSPHHALEVQRPRRGVAHVRLARSARLDRDIILRWAQGGQRPELALMAWRDAERANEPGAFLLRIEPPLPDAAVEPAARELVFVLDCSGSMSGEPLDAAKEVVRRSLSALRPNDTFQILRFSESASGLAPAPLTPTKANIARALGYLEGLQGGGGTHMRAVIAAALDPPRDPERMRIVSFLTDGYIGNEREIFALVQQKIGDARLFAMGIGSSVNRYLLEGLAEEGRGAAAFLARKENPDALVRRFVTRIATPVLTDIHVSFEGLEIADLEPARVPDLFAGQPLVLTGRYTRPGAGVVIVEAKEGGRPITLRHVVKLPEAATENEAVGRLWARRRIHRLEREQHGGRSGNVEQAVTELALRHQLMSAYTSFVAVDSVVSNARGGSIEVGVPVDLPAGVDRAATIGKLQSLGYAAAPRVAGEAMRMEAREKKIGRSREWNILRGAPTSQAGVSRDDARDRGFVEVAKPEEAESAVANFTMLVLVDAAGRRFEFESDGEVWQLDGKRRRLVRTLTQAELAQLRAMLAAAQPATWTGAGSGPHLVAVIGGQRYATALSAAGADLQALLTQLGQFTR